MSKKSKEPSVKKLRPILGQSNSAAAHAPAKEPTLLAVSIVLFALWFVFLLVTALFG
jgi:hypothetical protein